MTLSIGLIGIWEEESEFKAFKVICRRVLVILATNVIERIPVFYAVDIMPNASGLLLLSIPFHKQL